MAVLDLNKLTAGLSTTWAGFLRDWDRSLRSGNYPETTRYNYLLAAAQLARYLGDHSTSARSRAACAAALAAGSRRERPRDRTVIGSPRSDREGWSRSR